MCVHDSNIISQSHKKQRVASPIINLDDDDNNNCIACCSSTTTTIHSTTIMIPQSKSFDPLIDNLKMMETSHTAATSSATSVATEDYTDMVMAASSSVATDAAAAPSAADDGTTTTSRMVSSAPYDEEETTDCYAIPIATPISHDEGRDDDDHDEHMSTTDDVVPPPPTSPASTTTSSFTVPSICITGKFTNIEHKYHIDPKVLGTGHHGSVRRCIHRSTRQRYAVKSIRKTDPNVKIGGLHREIMLLQEMKHASIIQLVDIFEDEEYLHLVTELCNGGELFDKIVNRASSSSKRPDDPACFSEQEAARVLHEILVAVRYMHRQGVVHRDIKPENILFTSKDDDTSPIKIIDFGLARKFNAREDVSMSTVVGTPYYIAPEVLQKDYDSACDLWSVGVIAYILLCGYPPFNGADNAAVYASVRRGTYYFPSSDWKNVSYEARDFIRRLLQVDVTKRMSVEQALRHPWMVRYAPSSPSSLVDQREEMDEESSVEVVFRRGHHSTILEPQSPPRIVRRSMFGV
jgi:tRNA A-37 threonylcarbamoyl transferase component Bud32